ncbi:MAG TPA: 16S rRNA (cytosine(967)-C(5))-methyltransferase RsmB [Candidatus Sulfotelmatobacter sp.]|nr:16S rRNA (cytosine(967)-C(5))-methyltransferase RsmB [Candidatus Sulfotelmatobacter sp.]HWI57117.1 16S rRNA (cytosine(967)-C(5))-methyltransferase RsmB [Bacillota bacterium]
MSGQKPREIAVQVLGRRTGGDFVELLLERALAYQELSSPDRHLCQELVYGIVRWQATLDWLIARKTANRTQKPALQNLLRLGLYQIFWLERIPNHAAVHETVELAKRHGYGPQAGFINALLRGYLREFAPTKQLLDQLKTTEPAVGFSHPDWLVTRWQQRWGAPATEQLLAWNNSPPKTFARVNTLKTDAARLLPQWREENVAYDFVRHDWVEENLVFELKSHPPLSRMASFQQGLFYIQDPSTLLAVRELAPQPGDTVLDLCAAPGGKLTYIAQLMANQGRLLAHDTAPERLKLVEENCQRLGVSCAETVLPSTLNSQLSTRFDRILLDAPCSNTGVMRRRVDLRWRIRLEELARLRETQLELLAQAAGRLKRGGTLVYSTCSLEPEENLAVVKEFLSGQPEFTLETERELRPFAEGVDGAYVARLKRQG